jgi:ABC-type transport system involved in multi-copper enzyme maturation permease subunit
MNGLLTAIRSELFVSLRTFSSKLIILAPALIALAQLFIVKLTEAGQQARDQLLGDSEFEQAIASNAYGHFVDGLNTGLIMLGLLLVAQAAYSFSYERDIGSIRHLLIRRVSRSSCIIAKLLHLHLLAILSVLLLLAVSYTLGGVFWDYGAIVEDGFELIGEQEILSEIQLALYLAVLPIPATIAFGLLISVWAHSATQAVTTALGITLAVDIFKGLLGNFANYLYASFQPSLLDQSYLQSASRIVRGYSDVLIDERVIQLNMWVPFPALLILIAVALWLVQGKKI